MQNHVIGLFQELTVDLSGAILNLLFLVGSGCLSHFDKVQGEIQAVSEESSNHLCRTSRLIICATIVICEKIIEILLSEDKFKYTRQLTTIEVDQLIIYAYKEGEADL
jgi:hypothetical protein